MRLLYLDEGVFRITDDIQQPHKYAVLSHTWGEEEVTYQDVLAGKDHPKLHFIARRAQEAGLTYFWMDTCCIDKRNDAEIATAIRSMYRWYADAAACFVYLVDVNAGKRGADGEQTWHEQFKSCRWFTRGWTLQELLVAPCPKFYAHEVYLGDRNTLQDAIQEATGIDRAVLQGRLDVSHRQRLSWVSQRQTKLPEDRSYCMQGLCGVTMSPRYGEGGEAARLRLEAKIIKRYGTAALEISSAGSTSVNTREAALERLKFDVMDSRKQTIKKALAKTCAWLLTHPVFQSWLQEHGFLWIKGKPGTGKSVLMRFVDSHISANKEKEDICISFYFNARGDQLEKSFLGLYRSLLAQLMALPELQHLLDNTTAGLESSVEAMQAVFTKACLKLGRRLYIFIDALDECKEEDVSQMIEFFGDLAAQANDSGTKISTCFASRHYPILEVPTRLQLVLEDTDQHGQDIERYIRHQLKLGNKKQLDTVTADVTAKANGIFLWVVLVVEILKKEFINGRVHAVKKRLETIPPGLTELFKNIIVRDQEHIEEFLLCLQWILYAQRPLKLEEYYVALMISLDEEYEWDPGLLEGDTLTRYLLSSSKGLAELTRGNTQVVQFIHESVRDFLIHEDGFAQIRPGGLTAGSSHELLKQCCLRMLKQDEPSLQDLRKLGSRRNRQLDILTQVRPEVDLKAARARLNLRPSFVDYATASILHHSNEASPYISQYDFVQFFDIDSWMFRANRLHKHDVDAYRSPLDLVYVCAERGLLNLLTILADQGHELMQVRGQRKGLPLFAAIANKHTDVARFILQRAGATDIDSILGEVMVDKHNGRSSFDERASRTIWQTALTAGCEELAMFLIGRFAREAYDSKTLVTAALHGCDKVMKLLLDAGVSVNSVATPGNTQYSVLEAAIRSENITGVKLLLDGNVDIHARGGALRTACVIEHKELVMLLLETGLKLYSNHKNQNSIDRALYFAVETADLEILKLLLKNGANVNAIAPATSSTALYRASGIGNHDVVDFLLNHGANVDLNGGDCGTALQVAAWNGREEIVRTLLYRGADVNAIGGAHNTALEAGVKTGRLGVVRELLRYGALVYGEEGNRVIELAEAHGDRPMTELLRPRYLVCHGISA